MVELAVLTGTTPLGWERTLDHDPALISTALQVLRERNRRR